RRRGSNVDCDGPESRVRRSRGATGHVEVRRGKRWWSEPVQVLGTPTLRKEDAALLSGRGRYADDLPVPNGTLHAHVVRSPHAHAEIAGIEASKALAVPGVWAVITGDDVRKLSDPFLIALKAPVHQWSLAVERVRHVGEGVALVVAENRYIAEDAAALVRVDYRELPAVVDPLAAREKAAPLLHAEAKSNEIS